MTKRPRLRHRFTRVITSLLIFVFLTGCGKLTIPIANSPIPSLLEFTVTPTATNQPSLTPLPSPTTTATIQPSPTTSPTPTPPFSVFLERAISLEQEAYDVAWSPDGQTLAVATQNGVDLFDTETWNLFAHESMNGLVLKLVWMPGYRTDMKRFDYQIGYGLYTAGAGGVYFWNIGEKAPPRVEHLVADSACWAVAVRDQTLTISQSTIDSHKIVLEDLPFGKLPVIEGKPKPKTDDNMKSELFNYPEFLEKKDIPSEVRALAYSPDGSLLAYENTLYPIIWPDIPLSSLQHHILPAAILDLAWSPNNRMLAAGGSELAIWDVTMKNVLHQLQGHTKYIWSIAWSPDGRILASGSDDHTVRLWDTTSGEALAVLNEHIAGVSGVAWAPLGLRLASVGRDKMLRIWTFDAPWVPGSLQPTASMPLLAKASGAPITQQNLSRVGMIARIEDVKYPLLSNDGRYLAWSSLSALYSTDDRSTIYLMEVSSGTVTQIDGYAPVAFLADGSSLITLDQGRSRLMEWNLQGGLRLVKTHACGDCGSRNAVSPDGVTAVATNQTGRDIAVELRRLNGNAIENQAVQLLGEPIDEGLFRWAESFQFSPQGNLLAIIFNDGIAEIWRWKENRLLHTIDIKQRAIAWVAFSADEQTIWYSYVKINVSSMENYAGFDRWQSDSAGTLSLVQEFNLPDEQPFNYAYGLDLSPKLGLLAASEENGIIILWDVNKGQKLGSLESGEGIRSLIRFSPDGSLLLTLDQDGVLELWGVPSP